MLKIRSKDIAIFGIIIGLIIALTFKSCYHKSPSKDYTYKTDTIYSDKLYLEVLNKALDIIAKKNPKNTPPYQRIIYRTKNDKNITIKKTLDSLIVVIDSLQKQIKISDKYIKNFPENPKLLNFKLSHDSLDLTILNITGNINRNRWPVYLDKYSYNWVGDSLVRFKTKNTKYFKPSKPNSPYLLFGYDIIQNKPLIGGEYDFKLYKRLNLKADLKIEITERPKLRSSIAIRYRLLH